MMSRIKSRGTKPELKVRQYLHAQGYRFRLNVRSLPGKPDIVLKKHHLAIFVHGCFWHRHYGCRLTTTPRTNPDRWQTKFAQNVKRDRRTLELLQAEGWRTLVIWECGVRGKNVDLSWLPKWIDCGCAHGEWPKPDQVSQNRA